MSRSGPVTIEGYSTDELLLLPDDQLDILVFGEDSLVFHRPGVLFQHCVDQLPRSSRWYHGEQGRDNGTILCTTFRVWVRDLYRMWPLVSPLCKPVTRSTVP
jgi:hypothetical protein